MASRPDLRLSGARRARGAGTRAKAPTARPLSLEEAARYCHMSVRSLRRYLAAGALRATGTGPARRIARRALDAAPILTAGKVQALVPCSRSTLQRRIRAGIVRPTIPPGGWAARYSWNDVRTLRVTLGRRRSR